MIFRPKPCCPAFLSPCPSPSGPCAPWQEQGWPRKLSPAVTVTKQRGDGYRKPLMAHTVAVGPCHAAQEMVKQDGPEPGQPQAGEGPPLMTLLRKQPPSPCPVGKSVSNPNLNEEVALPARVEQSQAHPHSAGRETEADRRGKQPLGRPEQPASRTPPGPAERDHP